MTSKTPVAKRVNGRFSVVVQSMSSRTRSRISTKMRTAMQQLDHRSTRPLVSKISFAGNGIHTFILLNHPANLLETRLQLGADSVCHHVNIIKHFALLFELAAHVVGLLAQVAHGAEDAVQGLVLFLHDLLLLLLLEGGIVVVLLKRVRVGQGVAVGSVLALVLCVLDGVLQLVAHSLNLFSHLLHQPSPALHLIDLESEAVRIMFDGLDALHQVFEVLAEVLERLFELAPGLPQLGAAG
jgi:hypothetical protein